MVRDWNAWTERLHAAAFRWAQAGFARTFERESSDLEVLPRLLASPLGERHAVGAMAAAAAVTGHFTDIRHWNYR